MVKNIILVYAPRAVVVVVGHPVRAKNCLHEQASSAFTRAEKKTQRNNK